MNGKSTVVFCAEPLLTKGYVLGGCINAGYSYPFVSILQGKEISWTKQITVAKSILYGSINSIKPTNDDGFILTGYVDDSGSHKGYILKMDSKGNF